MAERSGIIALQYCLSFFTFWRIKMFPSFVQSLREKGHKVEYGQVDAKTMREYTIEVARNKQEHEKKRNKSIPPFCEDKVDASDIIDGRKYLSQQSFSSKTAIEHSEILKVDVGENDFCGSSTPYGGVYGVEVTHDADRHVCIRMLMWSYRHECPET